MSCKTIESKLALYMDNALTPVESQAVDAHLESCPVCNSLLVELRRDRASLQSLPTVLPPAGFRAELLRKAALIKPQRQSVVRYLVPRLSSLAAAIMVVLLASNLYVFPSLWPGQPVADETQPRIMLRSPGAPDAGMLQISGAGATDPDASAKSGEAAGKQVEDARLESTTTGEGQVSIQAAPPEQRFSTLAEAVPGDGPNLWLWSSLAGAGLFGLGTGFFVFRYRRI